MPSPFPTSAAAADDVLDADASARLRSVIGRLGRQLQPTPSGLGAGLSPTRTSLLLLIDRRGPLRLGEVAEVEGLNPTMLSRSITQLVDAGLVERTSDSGDRRAAWVSASRAGHELAERMRAERTEAVNRGLRGLAPGQQRVIARAIDALEALAGELSNAPA